MHQRQRAQHAHTALRGEAEPGQSESEGVMPEPCIRGSKPSMHAHPYDARQSQAKARARARGLSHASEAASPACMRKAIRGEAEPSQDESDVRPEPCIRDSKPSMHAQPCEARQSQAKARARACGVSHASEAASPACMHGPTRRSRTKPRRERWREA
jgi:hypothetical protein